MLENSYGLGKGGLSKLHPLPKHAPSLLHEPDTLVKVLRLFLQTSKRGATLKRADTGGTGRRHRSRHVLRVRGQTDGLEEEREAQRRTRWGRGVAGKRLLSVRLARFSNLSSAPSAPSPVVPRCSRVLGPIASHLVCGRPRQTHTRVKGRNEMKRMRRLGANLLIGHTHTAENWTV